MAAQPEPLPLRLRIDLAEAFVELSWEQIREIPASRGGIIADARYQAEKAPHMAKIDRMLEAMLGMYDQRRLEQTTEAATDS